MNVSLVMFKSDGARREFPVAKERFVVGRINSCDLRIPLSSVSRKHCEFTLEGDTVRLRDLGSSNGTYHNNMRIQETELEAGDEVVIGPVVFTVVIDGQPEKIEPVRTILSDAHQSGGESGEGQPSPETTHLTGEDDDIDLDLAELEPSDATVDMEDPIAALEALGLDDSDFDEESLS